MKTWFAVRLVFAPTVSIALYACAIHPRASEQALIGTWTNRLGTVWSINNDGTFDVDLDQDGRRDVWGNYTVQRDTITILGTGGRMLEGCKGNGVYHFNRRTDTLRFRVVHDKCKLRVKNVMLTWHRKAADSL